LILTPNERVLSFQVLDVSAKFRRNRFKIATVRARTDRHTDRDHTSDLIICPMLCYSNGTDKNTKYILISDIMMYCINEQARRVMSGHLSCHPRVDCVDCITTASTVSTIIMMC